MQESVPQMRAENSTLTRAAQEGTTVSRMRGVLSFEYEIVHVQQPIFDPSESTLARIMGARPALFVLDGNIDEFHGARLRQYSEATGVDAAYTTVPGEEATKTWPQVESVIDAAIRCELPRHGVIVAIGGGVVLDVAGLAASLYRRGVCYVRVPTSLIGLVDAGLGIKHGINRCERKSILGSFYPPTAVIVDRSFLATLGRRHVVSGMAEIVKLGVICDLELLKLLTCWGTELVESRFQSYVASAVLLRSQQALFKELEGNLFEGNLRRALDFGHSFSPAIESASDYTISHGEAVAMDMALAFAIALRRRLCPEGDVQGLFALYERIGLPVYQSVCGPAELMAALRGVQRHRAGALNFVLPAPLGRVDFLQDIAGADIEFALAYCRSAGGGNLLSRSSENRKSNGSCDRL